jgi:hypothetical protein
VLETRTVLVKAIIEPSGDHAGLEPFIGRCASCVRPFPSRSITQMVSRRTFRPGVQRVAANLLRRHVVRASDDLTALRDVGGRRGASRVALDGGVLLHLVQLSGLGVRT